MELMPQSRGQTICKISIVDSRIEGCNVIEKKNKARKRNSACDV